jgi:transposase-like protein
MKRTRKKFSPAFKLKVVLEALKEQSTLSEMAQKYEVHQNVISRWKAEFLEKAESVFDSKSNKPEEPQKEDDLYKEIGRMKIENDWLKKKLGPFQ